MGMLDSAREKATAALESAQRDITERSAEVEQVKGSLNQILQASDDQEVANRSAQEAEIKDLELQLQAAQAKVDTDQLANDVVGKLTDLPIISGPTEPIRQSYTAILAQSQADADQLQAQLSAAKAALVTPVTDADSAVAAAKERVDRATSRLAMAQGRQQLAQSALDAISGLTSKE